MNKKGRSVVMPLIVILILFGVTIWVSTLGNKKQTYSYADFMKDYEADKIVEAVIEPNKEVPTGVVQVLLKNSSVQTFNSSDVKEIEQLLYEKNIPTSRQNIASEGWFVTYVLPSLIILIVFVFFFAIISGRMGGGGGKGDSYSEMMRFGKSRARMNDAKNVKLKDVAGLKEEKEDLDEIIEFLKSPGKFTKVGARIPKGVLLEGPPGTG
ncbi:MAG: ATP-dependent metallopeptidase FtsH/Yme1/Tma family protein, partial [Lachnospiraceae bacterium]|nr:ATP-dependent metallopeptidase FtsH/Yme1/Tma family protein [Lachnospiraceae bacterium]